MNELASDIQQAAGDLLRVSAALRRRASGESIDRAAALSAALGELHRLSARLGALVDELAACDGFATPSDMRELRRVAAWLALLAGTCERRADEVRQESLGGPRSARKPPPSPPDPQTSGA